MARRKTDESAVRYPDGRPAHMRPDRNIEGRSDKGRAYDSRGNVRPADDRAAKEADPDSVEDLRGTVEQDLADLVDRVNEQTAQDVAAQQPDPEPEPDSEPDPTGD